MTAFLIFMALWIFFGYLSVILVNVSEHIKGDHSQQVEKWTEILLIIAFGYLAFLGTALYLINAIWDRWKENRRFRKLPIGPTGVAASLFGIKRPPLPPVDKRGYMD
jgi:4-hydroxybenzoate polyprenyltransferase